MRKSIEAVLVALALVIVFPANMFAAETSTPQPYVSTKFSKQTLTQDQKAAIAAARAAFVAAKTDAQNGFDRAVADAQAYRDQAIAGAGKDEGAIQMAKKSYRQSYEMILRAYKTDLRNAKLVLSKALAAAKVVEKSH